MKNRFEPSDDQAWAKLLSQASQGSEEPGLAKRLLEGLAVARASDGVNDASLTAPPVHPEVWNEWLSQACVLRPQDHQASDHVLAALRRQRSKTRILPLGGWLAGACLAAAVAGLLVLQTPKVADANDAYQAYQEASQGW